MIEPYPAIDEICKIKRSIFLVQKELSGFRDDIHLEVYDLLDDADNRLTEAVRLLDSPQIKEHQE